MVRSAACWNIGIKVVRKAASKARANDGRRACRRRDFLARCLRDRAGNRDRREKPPHHVELNLKREVRHVARDHYVIDSKCANCTGSRTRRKRPVRVLAMEAKVNVAGDALVKEPEGHRAFERQEVEVGQMGDSHGSRVWPEWLARAEDARGSSYLGHREVLQGVAHTAKPVVVSARTAEACPAPLHGAMFARGRSCHRAHAEVAEGRVPSD